MDFYDEELSYDEKWKKKFSSMLIAQMNERGISQYELAKQSGLCEATISKYVSRKSIPTATNILRISESLHCSLEDLGMFNV